MCVAFVLVAGRMKCFITKRICKLVAFCMTVSHTITDLRWRSNRKVTLHQACEDRDVKMIISRRKLAKCVLIFLHLREYCTLNPLQL